MLLSQLAAGLTASIVIHAVALFGVTFKPPDPRLLKTPNTALEVVLVNSKTASRPVKADVLAQANLDRGGNTDEQRRAKTPLPAMARDNNQKDDANLTRKVRDLEREAKQLMSQIKSDKKLPAPTPSTEPIQKSVEPASQDLLEKSLKMVQLEAQVARNMEAYQQRPKRTFIGARAAEFRFANYVDQWRQKIERVGNLNYPEEAKAKKIYGRLQLTVAIKSDGTLEKVYVARSSGHPVLDEAAKRIVHLAGPFARFPDDIRRNTDILEITRTWTFSRDDQVSAE
ncbi:MAG: energy transducer TonB [Burkholderiales bacterium]|nr:energy transducer TonB [Burkholderiales bacterium]